MALKIYTAHHQGTLLNCAITVDYNKTRTYLFGGSSTEHKEVMAPYAMHWQAMQDAKNAGLTRYDWWGIETSSGKQPGFVRFKMRWGGEEISYPPAEDISMKNLKYSAYKILRSINRLF